MAGMPSGRGSDYRFFIVGRAGHFLDGQQRRAIIDAETQVPIGKGFVAGGTALQGALPGSYNSLSPPARIAIP